MQATQSDEQTLALATTNNNNNDTTQPSNGNNTTPTVAMDIGDVNNQQQQA